MNFDEAVYPRTLLVGRKKCCLFFTVVFGIFMPFWGAQNKKAHPVRRHRHLTQVPSWVPLRCVTVFSGLAFGNCGYNFDSTREIGKFCEIWSVLCHVGFCVKYLTESSGLRKGLGLMTCGLNDEEMDWSLFSALIWSSVVDWAQSSN